MYALVTGGGGFLGRYIVEQLLVRGDRVRSFGRGDYPQLTELGVEVVRGDIADGDAVTAACDGIDCVFHTAGRIGIWGPWREFYNTSVLGTRNVIAACRAQGVGRLVFTGSPSSTFDCGDQCGVDESAPYPTRWMAYYPHTKALAEQAVLTANASGQLHTCSIRPHLIWGPRDPHLIPRIIQRARSGRLRRVGDGTNLVDITYVENAAEAHLLAADELANAESAAAGNAYFISQGEPVNCWRWIDDVLALVDLPPVTKSVSARAAWWMGGVCETVFRTLRITNEPPMTRFLAAQLATSHWFDIGAAQRDFGYGPRITTQAGMQRLAEWLHNHR